MYTHCEVAGKGTNSGKKRTIEKAATHRSEILMACASDLSQIDLYLWAWLCWRIVDSAGSDMDGTSQFPFCQLRLGLMRFAPSYDDAGVLAV